MKRRRKAISLSEQLSAALACLLPQARRDECGDSVMTPPGFKSIAIAPRDGSYIRLRFRAGIGRDQEVVGQWQPHEEMPAGGHWFDPDGNYITPGPLFWAPENGGFQ